MYIGSPQVPRNWFGYDIVMDEEDIALGLFDNNPSMVISLFIHCHIDSCHSDDTLDGPGETSDAECEECQALKQQLASTHSSAKRS